MKKEKIINLILLILIPLIGGAFARYYRTNGMVSLLLIYAAPSVYISIKNPKHVAKTTLFSFFIGIPLIIIFDFISHYTNTWEIYNTIFGFRLFNYVTIENMLWAFFHLYYTIFFYEHFIDKPEKNKIKILPRMKYILSIILGLFITFIGLYFFSQKTLFIHYFYMFLGIIVIVIPTTIFLVKYPKFINKFTLVTAYFFFFSILVEYVGLKNNIWNFPGNEFIGWVQLFGGKFPFEELFFWMMLFSGAILSFYEFFDDDRK